jgi:outer membrane protein TolC
MRSTILATLAFATVVAPEAALGQRPLSLSAAFAEADGRAYSNRLSTARREVAAAARLTTLRGILPSLQAEAGWMRSTDPLSAFGFTLRQRMVSQLSFDPNSLNNPAAISNVGGSVVLSLPVFNADAWLGRSAAGRIEDAAEAEEHWTQSDTRLQVVRAYYGGILAGTRVASLEEGLAAARSHVRRAELLHEQGLVTRSDVLLASVGAGKAETQLLAAQGEASLAVTRLAIVLGAPNDTTLVLPRTLPSVANVSALPSTKTETQPRADVEAARLSSEAATLDVRRATALLLPRIGSFARYDWNHPTSLIGGKPSWTVGIVASVSLFGGASELAERRRAQAQAKTATAMADALDARAQLEEREWRNELEVAVARLAIAERAVNQSAEAHRIMTRKYEGGLATITELLDTSTQEIASHLERDAAIYDVIVAAAAWRLAAGGRVTDLTVLDRNGAE